MNKEVRQLGSYVNMKTIFPGTCIGIPIIRIRWLWNYLYCYNGNSHVGKMASYVNDDVINWKHFLCYWPFVRGNPPVTGEFPSQGPVTWNFAVFFILRLNKRLREQSRRWWFETPSQSLCRHCNGGRNPLFSQNTMAWYNIKIFFSIWKTGCHFIIH